MADSLDQLNERFRAEVDERADRIGALLQALTAVSDPAQVCDEIRDHAHKLKGAAGMFGYDELKERAGELEEEASAQAAAADGATAAGAIAPVFAELTAAIPD